jgi:acyl-CoA synthetase (AMP-forming)/AMP-acid ligase II
MNVANGSAGPACRLPQTEVKIVDTATGETVPRNVLGEICSRGYALMAGYFENPEATAAALDADGWLHTGDLGTMDEAGYCRVQGRLKDMIIRGGENIFPREIEDLLFNPSKTVRYSNRKSPLNRPRSIADTWNWSSLGRESNLARRVRALWRAVARRSLSDLPCAP